MQKQLIFAQVVIFFILLFASCLNSDSNVKDGTKIVHFEGTDLVRQKVEYKNGKKNGYLIEYYRNGKIKTKQFFIDNEIDDTSRIYYENGNLSSLQIYKNKLKNGCWKEFNKDGKLISEIYLKNGFLDSTSTLYTYRTQKIITRITYKGGLKNGAEERFYNNGKPKSIAYYDMGRACKGTEEWYDDGTKINNDFEMYVSENNETLMKNTLSYVIRLQNPESTDEVYQVMRKDEGRKVGAVSPLKKLKNAFILEYSIAKNSFVMEEVTIAAFRKTGMGNTVIKTKTFNAASENFN